MQNLSQNKVYYFCNFRDTLFNQKSREIRFSTKSPGRWHNRHTDIATYRLNWPRGQFSERANNALDKELEEHSFFSFLVNSLYA